MKSLFFICLLLGINGMAVSLIKDYFYFSSKSRWFGAQAFCRQFHGSLASVTTEEEHQEAMKSTGQTDFLAWIGLNRTKQHVNMWNWTDGTEFKFTKWKTGEPDDRSPGEDCVVMRANGWYDTGCGEQFATICSRRVTLVKERKTWEDAFNHCKSNYIGLNIMHFKTQLEQLKAEFKPAQTASVWTGLRFLNGQWYKVNGTPLGKLASLPFCPARPYQCGAYNLNMSIWENRDCNEELNFLCNY